MIEEIDLDNRSDKPISEETVSWTKSAIRAALKNEGFTEGYQVSVSYVDAQEIRSLNAQYRQKDAVTDVLSFPMEEIDARGVSILGDIVLCVDRAKEQAEGFGHTFQREIAYLTVHSVLHLLGYDHENTEEKSAMRTLEKKIMNDLRIYKE